MTKKIDYFSLGLKPIHDFKHFVIGPLNQFAVDACKAVAKQPGDLYNPLFVYGPPGIGKTHMVQAVALEMIKKNPECKVQYLSSERLMSDVISAIGDDNVMTVRQHYSGLDLLIIDDVQYLAESQATQEELLHIFNNMTSSNNQTIVVGNHPPNKLQGFNQRLHSRFEGGLAVDVKTPDLDMRVEILRIKLQDQKLEIPDEMLLYVAQKLTGNVRELEGFIKRIHAYVTLSHQEITGSLVQSVITEVLPAGAPEVPAPIIQQSMPQRHIESAVPPPAPKAPDTLEPQNSLLESNAPPPEPAPVELPKIEPKKEEPAAEPPPPPPPPPPSPPVVPQVDAPVPEAQANENKKPEPLPKVDRVIDARELLAEAEKKKEEKAKAKRAQELKKNGFKEDVPALPPVTAQDGNVEVVLDASAPDPAPEEDNSEESAPELDEEEESLPAGHKEIVTVFFYPEGKKAENDKVLHKFQDVIKKHKLKFRLKCKLSQPYNTKGKINYEGFVGVCKEHGAPVTIVIGPPPDASVLPQDFNDLLSVTLDVQGISLQIVNWSEIDKDYRFLNLALDIALVKGR